MTNQDGPQQLSKAYEAADVEERLYTWWESSGYFKASPNPHKKPFTIIMPPPNVTGELHLGHALFAAVEDVLTRYHRMQGYEALWLPGKDHAGIATQMVVERALAEEGLDRHQLGREKFLERVWAWVDQYGGIIDNQLRRLGVSCDWSRLTFTLDPGPSLAVRTTFKRLYEKKLIYRGERMINWCATCRTALSDLEVDHADEDGAFYHIRYPLEGSANASGDDYIVVATTRPETLLGDTAVAVNPNDDRFASFHGKNVLVPILGRPIPIIQDEAVAIDLGTGALKITPGHDPNDFDTGERHGLPIINILNDDGTLNSEAGPYEGYDRFEARKAIVEQLDRDGLLEKIESHVHSVGHCQRSGDIVEPIVSKQWFVQVEPLAERALDAVKTGKIKIVPERFENEYAHWMENIHDWCISRQLWWGHRIPVWYCADCDHQTVAIEDPTACEGCGSANIAQDEDVLDTWFSSGLWPHSTLGWPEQTEDLKYFYPTAVMETGYDILFFWVARMIMLGLENMDDVPFTTVYLHGLIRDEHGAKMSKTKGNVIDPLEAISEYGTDALRFALTTGNTPGSDSRLSPGKLQAARNFSNKLWNVSRFVLSQLDTDADLTGWNGAALPREHVEDQWILSQAQLTAMKVNENIKDWQLGEAARVLHDFIWNDFADWYIELAKVRIRAGDDAPRKVLGHVLERSLRLLHPFMPFITEELWQHLTKALPREGNQPDSIMLAPYPDPAARMSAEDLNARLAEQAPAGESVELMIGIVRSIRNIRAEFKLEPARPLDVSIELADGAPSIETEANAIKQLARVGNLTFGSATGDGQTVKLVVGAATVTLAIGDAVDLAAERTRLDAEVQQTDKYIKGLTGRLSNEQFTSKAPPEVVEGERERLKDAQARAARIRELLNDLS
jgi:valyl-tRNA synthetase